MIYDLGFEASAPSRRWDLRMKKVSSDVPQLSGLRRFSHSKTSMKRSTRSLNLKSKSRSRISPGSPGSPVDGAKTSEYKSFKKLLEKTLDSGNAIPSKFEVKRLPLPLQNVSSIMQGFLSSPIQISQKHEFENKAKVSNYPARLMPPSKITSIDRLLYPSPQILRKNCGGVYSEPVPEPKGTFEGKRACLLDIAARTFSRNVNDFLSSRSDFIHEILQRLGIRRNTSKDGKLRKTEENTSAFQFPESSNKRNIHINDLCDNLHENTCAHGTGKARNHKIHTFPFSHSPKTSFKCKWQMLELFNEKGAVVLPDFGILASNIDRTQTSLDPPSGISDANLSPTDCDASCMGPLDEKVLNHKGPFDCAASLWNSKAELDCSSHRGNHDSFQADFVIINSCNSYEFFQEQALVPYKNDVLTGFCIQSPDTHLHLAKEQFTVPLLEWDASPEQELLPAPKCLFPEEVDHFTPPYFPLDIHNKTESSGLFDFNGMRSFSFIHRGYNFDSIFQNDPASSSILSPMLSIRNYNDDGDHSSVYSDYQRWI